MIGWEKVSEQDRLLIFKIANRAAKNNPELDKQGVEMDLIATHLSGCPLKLQEMLNGNDFDLMHDIYGINRHLCHKTGNLDKTFLPRFAQPKGA